MKSIDVLFVELLSDDLSSHASYIAGAVLLVVGLRAIADAWFGEHDDEAVSEVLGIYMIAMTGVMVCIDKLAIGFTMAFVDDLSIPGAIAVLVVISFVATLLGLAMGKRLGSCGAHRRVCGRRDVHRPRDGDHRADGDGRFVSVAAGFPVAAFLVGQSWGGETVA